MTIKKLITCGCSFTEGHLLSKKILHEEITWGSFIAKKKNWILHNIATGGMGNEWITQQTVAYLENNTDLKKDSLVIIGWSETGRQMNSFQASLSDRTKIVSVRPQDFTSDGQKSHWTTDIKEYHGYALKHGKIIFPFSSSYAYCFVKTYQAIFNLKTYLEHNNIPFIFFDALAETKIVSFEQVDSNNLYKLEYKTSYNSIESVNEYIDDPKYFKNYLNYNFNRNIFDSKFILFNNNSMLAEMRLKNYVFFTEGNEGHPNHHACDYFSDLILQEYEKLKQTKFNLY